MTLFNNKFRNAQLWIDAMKLREAQKEVAQGVVEVQPVITQPAVQNSQVIFTQEDRGHNEEESQKIQDIYARIKGFGFSPSYAG